jgi:choline kinase
MVTQTIILAAGVGARLNGSDKGTPKPLLTVADMPLIGHALAHAESSGCHEAVIVVGHESARVRAALDAIDSPIAVRFAETTDAAGPNGHSLLVAEPLAAPQFFLQMVDHVFATPVLSKLVLEPLAEDEAGRVLVDRAPINLDTSDATKVRLNNGRSVGESHGGSLEGPLDRRGKVTAIGKGIDLWDAIDAGCFVLTRTVFDALREVPAAEALTVSSAMRRLVHRGGLFSVDLAGVRWVDVDTPADRVRAERLLAARPSAQVLTP